MIYVVVLIVMLIAIICVSLRYAYLKKYSDNVYVDMLIAVIFSLIFSGFGIIGIINGIHGEKEVVILGIAFQIPLILTTVIYNILSVKYKKMIAVTTQDVKNSEWK